MSLIRARFAALVAWAKTSHVAAQGGRFLRLAVFAFAATGVAQSAIASSTIPNRAVLGAAVIGALETAYRQMVKVSPKDLAVAVGGSLLSGEGLDVSTILVDPALPDPTPIPAEPVATPVPADAGLLAPVGSDSVSA